MASNVDISLDDQETWDDTALIQSWDSAVDEYNRYHSLDQATHVTPGPPPTTRPVPTPAAGSSSSSQHPTDQTHDTHTTAHQQPSSQHDSDDMSDDYSPRAPSPPLPSTSRSIHPTSTSITNNTTEHHHDEEDDEDDDDEIFSTPLIPASQNPNPSSSTAAATSTLPAATKNNDISNPEATQLPPLPMNNLNPELKNLLMSWYWAGYYHGLYEGLSWYME